MCLTLIFSPVCFLFAPTAKDRCFQAEGRGALWKTQSQVDEMDAQTVLSLLFRSFLSRSKPGIPV